MTGCTNNTVAAFKQIQVAELHFQMLRAGMQFTAGNTDAAKPSLHPTGLDMGGSVGLTRLPAPHRQQPIEPSGRPRSGGQAVSGRA